MRKSLIVDGMASSCYFRTSIGGTGRKALVQITERCNLHCAHCFVSSTKEGMDIPLRVMMEQVVPRLVEARVERITLTGGEPWVHPDFMQMCRLITAAGIPVGVCTNATRATNDDIAELAELGGIHINVSFDGFRAETHGKFRGNQASFATTVDTTRKFAEAGLLQGLLSTPNALTDPDEYADLCAFAVEIGAKYVLMNPLSAFGRGVKSQGRMAANADKMRAIQAVTARFADDVELVNIRFPNDDKPLAGCDAGKLIYVYADGQTAVCPYLSFAARSPFSPYHGDDSAFMVGSIFDQPIAEGLDGYDLEGNLAMGTNYTCGACSMSAGCGKGCPAAVIARGEPIGALDAEQCPVAPEPPLLTIGRWP